MFVRKIFYPLHLLLYKLSLLGLGIKNYENEQVSGEKAFIKFLLKGKYLQDGAILDIGANVGNYSVMLRTRGIRLPLFAFEPHPAAFRKLQQAAAAHQFTAVPLGAGEQSEAAAMYDYHGQGGSEHASMYKHVIEELHHGQVEEVAIHLTTLDEFVQQQNIRKISLLKIDTEGHESSVLKGASHIIASGMVEVIQIEFNEMNIISRTFFRDFVALLPGYDFYRLLPDGLQQLGQYNSVHHEIFSFQNIVALKNHQ